MNNTISESFFYCKTNNGHILKPIIEAYNMCTKFIILNITKIGIYSYVLGENNAILIKSVFPATKFDKYVCLNNINIMIATDELHLDTKNIKRKNTTHMFILKSSPDQFAISISSNDENDNSNISRIKVTEVYDSIVFDTNFKYEFTYKINARDLNRTIKELVKVGNIIDVVGYPTYIILRYSEEDIIKKEYKFNNVRVDETENESIKSSIYSKSIDINLLNSIAKAITISKQISISISNNLPIHIEIDSGSIVVTDVFIKTIDMLND